MDNAPLQVGQMAPEFDLPNQNRQSVKLADFRGKKKVVLLFYPMDFSPVCTQEHCSFGPSLGKIKADENTVVFGVSCDSPFAHAAFGKQYNIPYDLLSDMTRKTSKAYGLFAGEEPYNCSKRGTVVIDQNGKIAFWQEVPMKEARKVEAIAAAAAQHA
jgi:peroxiredoxin